MQSEEELSTEEPTLASLVMEFIKNMGVLLAVCGLLCLYVYHFIMVYSNIALEWPIHLRLWCIRAAYKRMGATRRELEEPKLPSRHDASEVRRWAALQVTKRVITYGGSAHIEHLEMLNEEFVEAPTAATLCRLRTLYIEECRLIMLLAERRIKNSK